MGATFARIKTWIAGETLTASDQNAEFDNILNNFTPTGMDDTSVNDAAMRATRDPYPGSVISKPTDLAGELQGLRYLLKQITGQAQWYIDPAGTMVDDTSAQTIAGTKTFTSVNINESTEPKYRFKETGVTADNGTWEFDINGEQFKFRVLTDAGAGDVNILTVDRTGTTVDEIDLLPTTLKHNGVKVPTISSTDNLTNKTLIDPILTLGGTTWPSFSVTLSADQDNITGTDQIEWDTEVWDNGPCFGADAAGSNKAAYRFAPGIAGKYLLTVSLWWKAVTASDALYLHLYKNGVQHKSFLIINAETQHTTTLTTIVDANGSTDYFDIFAVNNDRDTSDIDNDTSYTFWQGSRIA